MRTSQVARIAGISQAQVWHCLKTGKLKGFQSEERGWFYVWPADVQVWLEARARRQADLAARRPRP